MKAKLKESVSIAEDLFRELEFITSRLINISQNFNQISDLNLKERLNKEYIFLQSRIKQISKIAEIILEKSNNKFSFSAILLEKSSRSLSYAFKNQRLFLR